MSKLGILSIIALAVLIWGGVIEVRFSASKLGEVPGKVIGLFQGQSSLASVTSWGTNVKRDGETWIIKDEQQRIQVALGYIKNDAERLIEVKEDVETETSDVLIQADLLLDSVSRVDEISGRATADNVASLREEIKDAFRTARSALDELKELQEEYSSLRERFATATQSIEWNVGEIQFAEDGDGSGAVAGAKDDKTGTEDSAVPLEF